MLILAHLCLCLCLWQWLRSRLSLCFSHVYVPLHARVYVCDPAYPNANDYAHLHAYLCGNA